MLYKINPLEHQDNPTTSIRRKKEGTSRIIYLESQGYGACSKMSDKNNFMKPDRDHQY
jgi:hypothetical protein